MPRCSVDPKADAGAHRVEGVVLELSCVGGHDALVVGAEAGAGAGAGAGADRTGAEAAGALEAGAAAVEAEPIPVEELAIAGRSCVTTITLRLTISLRRTTSGCAAWAVAVPSAGSLPTSRRHKSTAMITRNIAIDTAPTFAACAARGLLVVVFMFATVIVVVVFSTVSAVVVVALF